MSVEQYQRSLLECLASGEPTVVNAAQQANELTEMMKRGELSKDEYMGLMTDIGRQANIDSHMNNFEAKQKLNVAINGLIHIASMI
ncbi:MAG: hypothetical protein EBU90_20100 [Proteobacteria bacterium]|nr:hypothetical protein [Pseudomonadota bacterium]NBP14627.1 hypothetical protein [bacterium]